MEHKKAIGEEAAPPASSLPVRMVAWCVGLIGIVMLALAVVQARDRMVLGVAGLLLVGVTAVIWIAARRIDAAARAMEEPPREG